LQETVHTGWYTDILRDHCHLTDRYCGSAHSNYNLNYKDSFYIPIVFHNLSGYNSHFINKEIATAFEGKIDVLPITKEKYISFTKHVKDIAEKSDSEIVKLRFIDLYKFLSTSLNKLGLFLNIEKLKITRSDFSKLAIEDFNLLTHLLIRIRWLRRKVEGDTSTISRIVLQVVDTVFENDYTLSTFGSGFPFKLWASTAIYI